MHCPQCGVETNPGAAFCQKCGARLSEAPAPGAATTPGAVAAPVQRFNQALGAGAPGPQGVDEPEQTIWEGGYSLRAMFGAWIGAGVVSIAVIAAGAFLFPAGAHVYWIALAAAVVLMWLWLLMQGAARRMGVHYRLTTQRLFRERGVFGRVTDRIEVIHIDDVTQTQGFAERLVGVGSILVTSTDHANPQLLLTGIDNVITVADMIDKARRAERNKRAVRVDAI